MNALETLNLILDEVRTLKGSPLTYENLQWFKFYIEAVREVASPSDEKDYLLSKWERDAQYYTEILHRRTVSDHQEQVRKANGLRFVAVYGLEDDEEPEYYWLTRG